MFPGVTTGWVLGYPEAETGGQTGYLRLVLCSGSCWSPLESLDLILSEDETQRRSQWGNMWFTLILQNKAQTDRQRSKVRGQPHLDYTWMGPGSTDLQRHRENMRTQNHIVVWWCLLWPPLPLWLSSHVYKWVKCVHQFWFHSRVVFVCVLLHRRRWTDCCRSDFKSFPLKPGVCWLWFAF